MILYMSWMNKNCNNRLKVMKEVVNLLKVMPTKINRCKNKYKWEQQAILTTIKTNMSIRKNKYKIVYRIKYKNKYK